MGGAGCLQQAMCGLVLQPGFNTLCQLFMYKANHVPQGLNA